MKQKSYAFSKKALVSATPLWAKWVFRAYVLLAPAVGAVITSDPAISELTKTRILLYISAFTPVVLGLSKMFGVEPSDEEVDEVDQSENT